MAKLFELTYQKYDWSSENVKVKIVANTFLRAHEKAQILVKKNHYSSRVISLSEIEDNIVMVK